MPKPDTSWNSVAGWYDDHLENNPDTYQRQVIWPNLKRLLDLKPGERLLDLACGSGFFSRELARAGATVLGVDLSPELIKLAEARPLANLTYQVAPADELSFITDQSLDQVIIVLALQNIASVKTVLTEVKRILKPSGRLSLVLNHPAFRVPGASAWGFDSEQKLQYRRVEHYLHESQAEIVMHPGKNPGQKTISFHRPLQYYFKLLSATGFVVARLEEWISHKESEPGPRAEVENRARSEFPLFLYLQAKSV